MKTQLPDILDCGATVCAYNQKNQCHAFAITVGDGDHPMCDTGIISDRKGGLPSMTGKVGACKVEHCQFNTAFECSAPGIHVGLHTGHADCSTFKAR